MSYPPLPSNGETGWGDKFITWADALEDRKVEGSALALRLDATVGTRIFLDHSWGSAILYGNTGWRDISEFLHEDWVMDTRFRIRRQNNSVQLRVRINRAVDSPQAPFSGHTNLLNTANSTLWAGFRPPDDYLNSYAYATSLKGYPLNLQAMGHKTNLRITSFGAPGSAAFQPGDSLQFDTSWTTDDPWPTTLPGTPV